MLRTRSILVPVATVLLIVSSCVVREPVMRISQLVVAGENETLVLLGRDNAIYRLPKFRVHRDTITGTGTRQTADSSSEFDGVIAFNDIEYAQLEHNSGSGAAVAMVPVLIIGASAIAMITQEASATVTPYRKSQGGGESCPYVYSWNGREYVLEAETFGTSLGRALQRTTRHVLPSLRSQDGTIRVRMSDERPETHYIDQVRLVQVRHAPGTQIVMDTDQQPWQIGTLAAPASVTYDAAPDASAQYRFVRPPDAGRALLVVTAVNREMTGGVFHETFAFLGRDALRFVRDLEQDEETVDLLRDWLQRCALQVSCSDGNGFHDVGAIDPEGTAVAFTRALPLDFTGDQSDEIVIRLEALPGLWDIHDVRIAWDAVGGLEEIPLQMQTCIGPEGVDQSALLAEEDGAHAVLIPPQAIDLTFSVPDGSSRETCSYCIAGSGYLHLWYPGKGTLQLFAAFEDMPQRERLGFVHDLMRQPDLVMPLLRRMATANVR